MRRADAHSLAALAMHLQGNLTPFVPKACSSLMAMQYYSLYWPASKPKEGSAKYPMDVEDQNTNITNDIPDEQPSQADDCFLFNLPPELRNRIYRYAIVEDDELILTPRGPSEPTLLRTCRSIRDEACSIYYGENKFLLRIENWNGVAFQDFLQQHTLYAPKSKLRVPYNMGFLLKGVPNWDNMV